MTRPIPRDAELTGLLVEFAASGVSWLRHSNGAGRLDWALLHGATAEELEDIRGRWRNHIHHLTVAHGVLVEESPSGFHRIVGTRPISSEATEALVDPDPDGEVDPQDAEVENEATELGAAAADVRFNHTAAALVALHAAHELHNPMHKAAIVMMIRQASESNHWHNTAHYRSEAAAELIASASIRTLAQYQAFCNQNLRHEHMVPNIVLYRMIVSNPKPTHAWIVDLFARFSKRATITREEDRLLRATDMPQGFYAADNRELFENPLARYIEAGFADRLAPRTTAGWF